MHDVPARMKGSHHLLTGGAGHPTWRCEHSPRHFGGDLGLLERKSSGPRRSLRASLLW